MSTASLLHAMDSDSEWWQENEKQQAIITLVSTIAKMGYIYQKLDIQNIEFPVYIPEVTGRYDLWCNNYDSPNPFENSHWDKYCPGGYDQCSAAVDQLKKRLPGNKLFSLISKLTPSNKKILLKNLQQYNPNPSLYWRIAGTSASAVLSVGSAALTYTFPDLKYAGIAGMVLGGIGTLVGACFVKTSFSERQWWQQCPKIHVAIKLCKKE